MNKSESTNESWGFTLMELMVIVGIIGLLAVISIPNFLSYRCKSNQSEAKTNLSAIANLEESYYGINEIYISCADHLELEHKLGWKPVGNTIYSYSTISKNNGHSFIGEASGVIDSKNDVWQINEKRLFDNLSPGCQ